MSLRDKVQKKINNAPAESEVPPKADTPPEKSRKKEHKEKPRKEPKKLFRKDYSEDEKKELIDKAIKGKTQDSYEVPTVTDRQIRVRNFLTFLRIILPPVLLIIFLTQVILLGFVPSTSMVPTLKKNDLIVTNRLAYAKNPVKRGDVIVFIRNSNFLVKRVIGLPGDTVTLNDGLVYVNGMLLDESYVPEGVFTLPFGDGNNLSEFSVPEGKLLVFGDNRPASADSRFWTDSQGEPLPYVTMKNIKGKVLFSFSFTHGFNLLRDPVYEVEDGLLEEKETTEEMSQQLHPEEKAPEDSVILETLPVSDIEDTKDFPQENTQETLPLGDF